MYVAVRWNGQELRVSQPRPLEDSVIWGEAEEEDNAAARKKKSDELKALRKGNQPLSSDLSPLPPQIDPVGASVFTMYVPANE